MTDFLFELRSEEIPARMQVKAKEDLARLFNDALAKAGLAAESVETFATPRRLALIAKRLPLATEAVAEETKGPKVGAPPQAMEGFLRKTGLTQDQLVERDGVYFAVVEKAGKPLSEILAIHLPLIVWRFPWPKSMRWGDESFRTDSLRWVRPLQSIVAILGEEVLPINFDMAHLYQAQSTGDLSVVQSKTNLIAGAATMGHRFHHSGPITIGNAGDYIEKLRACHVIVHFSERCAIIRDGAKAAAEAAGLTLVEDEGLVAENAGLTEWPVPMLGRFDPAFLEVPEEVIQLTARVNQKYFVCQDADGKLANAFVCTANIVANDGGAAIVAGNEKVLAARLSDAKFFWEQDLKVALDEQAKKLSQITFHEKLGTVADKVERVAKLAHWLVEEGIVTLKPVRPEPVEGQQAQRDGASTSSARTDVVDLAAQAERAARLCKADLVTGMVGEFPELQGIMGGYYARAQGESDAVADAVRDHYKPVGQGDDVPTAPVTVAVSLADKFDTLAMMFSISQTPTGSKDPFGLRRAAIGINSLCQQNDLDFNVPNALAVIGAVYPSWLLEKDDKLREALKQSIKYYDKILDVEIKDPNRIASYMLFYLGAHLIAYLNQRTIHKLKSEGNRHDFIEAVMSSRSSNIADVPKRASALQKFLTADEGANLLVAYKRAANLLKQADGVDTSAEALSELGVEEQSLLTALDTAEPKAAAAVDAEDFEGAMAALASLRAPIDAFFEGVMVNDPDPDKRAFRLGLLIRFRDAVHRVADFSKIEG